MQDDLTAEMLRSLIHYDPKTGVLRWLDRPGQKGWVSSLTAAMAGHLNGRGYRIVLLRKRSYKAHRLAWLYVHGEWPASEIDHIDGDRDNNAIANLRLATPSQNSANRRKRSGSSSQFKGVHWHALTGKWAAAAGVSGRKKHLGLFDTEVEAARAYEAYARSTHGQFTRLD